MAEFEPQLKEEVALLCQVLPCWQGSSRLTLCLHIGGRGGKRGGREVRGEGKREGGREGGRREREREDKHYHSRMGMWSCS